MFDKEFDKEFDWSLVVGTSENELAGE